MAHHKKGGWMLGCPEVRKRNNCSAYFDFFFLSSLATIHSEINTFFFLKINWCFTATECWKSEFFVRLKPLKGSYFGSVALQWNKFSVFHSFDRSLLDNQDFTGCSFQEKYVHTETEHMSTKSSCYLTNFKHSLLLLMKTGTNWGRTPHHRNFSVIFFFTKNWAIFLFFRWNFVINISTNCLFKGITKNETPKWIYESTVCGV